MPKCNQANYFAEERRLAPDPFVLPLPLGAAIDTVAVSSALQRAQEAVGSLRHRGGGNMTRRILLVLNADGQRLPADLGAVLSRASAMGAVTEKQIVDVLGDASTEFSPDSVEDARTRTLKAIAQRQGQPRFRRALLQVYDCRCAFTGCDLPEVLEAAHIVAYRGRLTNHIQNGLLLRSDVHVLFDRGLIGVDPNSWRIVVHPRLLNTHYGALSGEAMRRPSNAKRCPSAQALLAHLRAAGLDDRAVAPVKRKPIGDSQRTPK
jgi:hypothetical protein